MTKSKKQLVNWSMNTWVNHFLPPSHAQRRAGVQCHSDSVDGEDGVQPGERKHLDGGLRWQMCALYTGGCIQAEHILSNLSLIKFFVTSPPFFLCPSFHLISSLCPPQGLLYAYNISHLVRTVMNLHVALSKPMNKSAVLSLCRLIELLKVRSLSAEILLSSVLNHTVKLIV